MGSLTSTTTSARPACAKAEPTVAYSRTMAVGIRTDLNNGNIMVLLHCWHSTFKHGHRVSIRHRLGDANSAFLYNYIAINATDSHNNMRIYTILFGGVVDALSRRE